MSVDVPSLAASQTSLSKKIPYFFREEYAALTVKGNFMTLATKPGLVEDVEWIAHQVVEQYRLLDLMIQAVSTVDEKTGQRLCNSDTCPTMSASGHTYTWLDVEKRPIKIPALVDTSPAQSRYPPTTGNDAPIAAGPTNLNLSLDQPVGKDWLGKSSGFPEDFERDAMAIYRQMMRCYAHLYHGHWLDPFWHVNAYKELNTCFIHFVNVGRLFGLLSEKELNPMAPLIDMWEAMNLLPPPPVLAETE